MVFWKGERLQCHVIPYSDRGFAFQDTFEWIAGGKSEIWGQDVNGYRDNNKLYLDQRVCKTSGKVYFYVLNIK